LFKNLLRGLTLSLESLTICIQVEEVQYTFFNLLWMVLVVLSVTYIFTQLVLLPAHLLLWLGALFIDTADARLVLATWVSQSRLSVVRMAPTCALIMLRYVVSAQMERVFFATLSSQDAEFAESLRTKTPGSFSEEFPQMLKGLGKLLMFSPVYLLLSYIPHAGIFLSAYFQFKSARRWLGTQVAIVLAILCCSSYLKSYLLVVFQAFLAQMFFFYELMLPYFSRARLSRAGEQQFISSNLLLILGFIIPYSLLLYIPFVGPFLWVICQSSVSLLLLEMKDKPHI